jgi:hypothetical protein
MRSRRLITLVIACWAAFAAPALAQSSSRPYRGLFGGGQPLSSRSQSLDLTLSGFGGWDEPDEVPPQPGLTDAAERVELQGPFSGGSATLVYTRPGEKLNMSGYGSGFLGYFPDNENPWYKSSSAGFNAASSFELTQKTHLRLGGQASWATDFRAGFLGGGTPGSDIPLAGGSTGFETSIERAPSITTQSDAGLTHEFTQKSWLSAGYNYRYVYFFERDTPDATRPTGQDHVASIFYNYRFTRYATLNAGYAYRRSSARTDPDAEPLVFHDINLGVNYGRTLSFSRKTKFSFNTGSTVVSSQDQAADDAFLDQPRFFVIGSAVLTHEIGRSWTAHADYNRQVNFQDGFDLPSVTDSASAGVGGLLGRRTDLSGGVYWTTAAIGLEENNFQSWVASTQVRTAITRSLAVYAYYYYYLHDFGAGVQLPQGFVREVDRQGIRFGLTTWLPLWASRGTP